MQTKNPQTGSEPNGHYDREDLQRYFLANSEIESNRHRVEELEHGQAVELFQKQLSLLQNRLAKDPRSFRHMFIAEGIRAIAWEFQQDELAEKFTKTLWDLLLRGDDTSAVILRFIWNIPLKFKRKFVRAIDLYLSDRYPMFKGLSNGWPGENGIPPYIRPPEQRSQDFELVNQAISATWAWATAPAKSS